MIRVGVLGYGYWGPNVVRNLHSLDSAQLVAICDQSPLAQERARRAYPCGEITSDTNEILRSPDVDAVAIITPVWTHFELAKAALENGKHVFVEKPFTANSDQAEDLIELAQMRNLKIMVDHTFLFTGAVRKIRQLIDEDELGDLYYYDSMRVNLGLFQHDIDVIWDLAPHDLSIMDYLIPRSLRPSWPRGETFEWPCRRGVHHDLFPAQDHRSHQCELAVAGEGPDHADRGREEDGRVERP